MADDRLDCSSGMVGASFQPATISEVAHRPLKIRTKRRPAISGQILRGQGAAPYMLNLSLSQLINYVPLAPFISSFVAPSALISLSHGDGALVDICAILSSSPQLLTGVFPAGPMVRWDISLSDFSKCPMQEGYTPLPCSRVFPFFAVNEPYFESLNCSKVVLGPTINSLRVNPPSSTTLQTIFWLLTSMTSILISLNRISFSLVL